MDFHEYAKKQIEFKKIQAYLVAHKEEYAAHIIERIKNGEKQAKLARELGISRQCIHNVINNYRLSENLPIDTRKQRFPHKSKVE